MTSEPQAGDGDMVDSADEVAVWAPLPLALCGPIDTAFFACDREALSNQRWHQRLTLFATLCGGFALLIGVWNLGFGPYNEQLNRLLTGTEVALVVLGAVAIILGLSQRRKNRWLVNRHKAELLRFLKFEFLITPSAWGGSQNSGGVWVSNKIGAIDAIRDRRALEEAVSTSRIADDSPATHGVPSPTLMKLVEYYLDKRLSPQKEYLANRAQRNAFWDSALQKNINSTLFFLSVLSVFVQDVVNWRGESPGMPRTMTSVVFTTLGAASLPVIASMVRTLRAAFEFSRNRTRFLSAHDALSKIEQRLTHRLLSTHTTTLAPDAEATILRELERCEAQLRNEHTEWLRLMLEAEWFG